jgi:hypothetical protein
MPEESALATIRAAVDAIVPAVDGRPGAVEMGVDRHVADLIDLAFPGFVDLVAILLDAYASDVRPGASFVALTLDERGEVFRQLSSEPAQDARDVIDALLVFTYGGVYSEWTGLDRATGRLRPPDAWRQVGYPGPVAGHPAYRVAAEDADGRT